MIVTCKPTWTNTWICPFSMEKTTLFNHGRRRQHANQVEDKVKQRTNNTNASLDAQISRLLLSQAVGSEDHSTLAEDRLPHMNRREISEGGRLPHGVHLESRPICSISWLSACADAFQPHDPPRESKLMSKNKDSYERQPSHHPSPLPTGPSMNKN